MVEVETASGTGGATAAQKPGHDTPHDRRDQHERAADDLHAGPAARTSVMAR